MSSKNIINKMKVGILLLSMFSSGAGPVFASEQYPGHDYPAQLYGMPVFFISRIDLTNNQLEFSLNKNGLYGKVLKNFGAGWIADHSEVIENMSLLSYDSVSNAWSQRVFWSDDNDISIYVTHDEGTWRKYTVDSEVDLKSNTFHKLFYIAEFEDGDKWISRISYEDCANAWTEGMLCKVRGYNSESLNYDHTNFGLGQAPKKTTPVEEPVVELTPEPVVEPTSEPTPEPASELVPESVSEPEVKKEEQPATEENESDTVKTVKNIMVLSSDIEENDDEETDEEEIDLAPEGPGDTTIEVPNLGKTEKYEFNWLPYFLGGAALGGVSTWFLIYLNNKRKLPFLR